jgi:hypothetical protein
MISGCVFDLNGYLISAPDPLRHAPRDGQPFNNDPPVAEWPEPTVHYVSVENRIAEQMAGELV